MTRERIFWGASLGAILGYVLAVLTSYPIRIIYYPHSDQWGLVDMPGEAMIRWYGRVINAAIGALVGMAIMWPIRRPVRWPVIWILAIAVMLMLAFHERHWFRL